MKYLARLFLFSSDSALYVVIVASDRHEGHSEASRPRRGRRGVRVGPCCTPGPCGSGGTAPTVHL